MNINGTVGLGLIGMWAGELCHKGTLPAKGVKTAAVVDTDQGTAAMFMPFKAVHDRVNNRTYYSMDELTHAPVVSFQYWAADGVSMEARSVERVHFARDNISPGDVPVMRFGPNLVRSKDEWPTTGNPSDILQMYLDAWLPEDEVCFGSPEDHADAMLRWPEHRIQAECAYRIESMETVFHTRAAFDGRIESMDGSGIKVASGRQKKWYPRPSGVDYAPGLMDGVRRDQPLFLLSSVMPGSPAWQMLVDNWRARMFATFGRKTYVQARHAACLPYRCPVCLRDMEKGETCNAGHEPVLSAPLCPDVRVSFTDRRLNYSGEMADVRTFLPDLERSPAALRNGRARGSAIALRAEKRAKREAESANRCAVVDTADV